MKNITIDIPEGYIIDTEKSSLETGVIILKKKSNSFAEELKLKLINYNLDKVYSHEIVIEKSTEGPGRYYVKVPLPTSNTGWSIQAWEKATKICKLFNGEVEHGRDLPFNYIHIEVRRSKYNLTKV